MRCALKPRPPAPGLAALAVEGVQRMVLPVAVVALLEARPRSRRLHAGPAWRAKKRYGQSRSCLHRTGRYARRQGVGRHRQRPRGGCASDGRAWDVGLATRRARGLARRDRRRAAPAGCRCGSPSASAWLRSRVTCRCGQRVGEASASRCCRSAGGQAGLCAMSSASDSNGCGRRRAEVAIVGAPADHAVEGRGITAPAA